MSWIITQQGFDSGRVALVGNQFLLSNGYLGYRGTLEEFGKDELVGCVLSGVYDQVGDAWREPVNAPNGLWTRVWFDNQPLDARTTLPSRHEQQMDMKRGVHGRETSFLLNNGANVVIRSERFTSIHDVHILAMRYEVQCETSGSLFIETGIDGDVWDINGPHLENVTASCDDGLLVMRAETHEMKIPVVVAESATLTLGKQEIKTDAASIARRFACDVSSDETTTLTKYVAIYSGKNDVGDVRAAAIEACRRAAKVGYDALLEQHARRWSDRWKESDVAIEGDDDAQRALRYSIYLLLSAAPTHSDRVSIPARGLSGQVYKGGIFWDTEMFMLPMFTLTHPDIAKNLVRYRVHTLDGARRKAAEYGYEGAFYAWESQETGDDACTLFNINDVFTGRPIRTFFRDKQIHISGDVALAIWQVYQVTGDDGVLLEGGAEVILEAARFYRSWAYYKLGKGRYEMLDVLGPDEYHDRVHNNAFTNYLAWQTIKIALDTLKLLHEKHPDAHGELVGKLKYEHEVSILEDMRDRMYLPQPDAATQVIEQFDGYLGLEDVSLDALKARIKHPNEYLGGHGPASTTQIIKQADVVMLLRAMPELFDLAIQRANWEFYAPRTEHGSSLSACAYAIVAARIGEIDFAYDYFLKTATIDLTGESRQYIGDQYIGGTHPAANGGAWMTAILGLAGLDPSGRDLVIKPHLPPAWTSLRFVIHWHGQRFALSMSHDCVSITADASNAGTVPVIVNDEFVECPPGGRAEVTMGNCR